MSDAIKISKVSISEFVVDSEKTEKTGIWVHLCEQMQNLDSFVKKFSKISILADKIFDWSFSLD